MFEFTLFHYFLSQLARKKKQEEEREEVRENVSSDLLAAINKPSEPEPPKKSIESQLKAQKAAASPRATNLTGRAAEREAERLKREAEREERAAQRAREREEAARKRKGRRPFFLVIITSGDR